MAEATTLDETVRPRTWDDYIGQHDLKRRLEVSIEAALRQERTLDDILLVAPPGTGKSTLASLIARKYISDFEALSMPADMDVFLDICETFTGVLLLDELHNAPKAFQEMLQTALLDKVVRTSWGYKIDVSDIVFVGATVREYRPKILEPLQQRFQIQPTWVPYADEEIAAILAGMATRLGFEIPYETCAALASACGGTPRLAKRFVCAARDLAAVGHDVTVESVLDHVGVDADGLGAEHMEYLATVRSQGGRAGLRNLANLMGMSVQAVEDLERILAVKGFVHLTPSGRRLTPAGGAKIGVTKERARA